MSKQGILNGCFWVWIALVHFVVLTQGKRIAKLEKQAREKIAGLGLSGL